MKVKTKEHFLQKVLEEIKKILLKNNLSLSSAESCTGGLVSSYLTDISGASGFIFQNFVTYSNEAKHKYLSVKNETLEKYGAVSNETAYEMSSGLLDMADTSIATTGILGPTGGTKEKPIGLCYISLGIKKSIKKDGKKEIEVIKFISKKDNRLERKVDITEFALKSYLEFLKKYYKLC